MPYLGNFPVSGDNSFRILDDISTFTQTFDGSSSATVSVSDSSISLTGHRFITGQRVTYTHGGGTEITGLTSDSVYYIVKTDQNTIKLAPTYADAINNTNLISITGLGVGSSHTLNVAFDGINTKFKATYNDGTKSQVTRAAQLQISINGVIQRPFDTATPSSGFGIETDSAIVFSSAPIPSDVFWGNVIANNFPTFDTSDNTVDSFVGDGTQTNFTLSKTSANNQNLLVTINGVVQYPTDATNVRAYSVTGNVLTFAEAPGNGTVIQVRHIGFAGATSSAVTGFYGRTGNVGLTTSDSVVVSSILVGTATSTGTDSQLLQVNSGAYVSGSVGVGTTVPNYLLHVGSATTSLYVVGQSQLNRVAISTTSSNIQLETGRTYVYYSSITLTLPASPTAGDRLEIINRSGTVTAVLARNGSNIMGVSADLDLDIIDSAFKVTYSNDTDGWVVST